MKKIFLATCCCALVACANNNNREINPAEPANHRDPTPNIAEDIDWGLISQMSVIKSAPKDPETGARTAPVVKPEDWVDYHVERLSEAFSTCAKEYQVELSIKDLIITHGANIILKLNGNSYFSDDATIKVDLSKYVDLETIVSQIQGIMSISSKQGKMINSMVFKGDRKVPVTYKN